MYLEEMDRKVLALIEELNPDNKNLTGDPDIAAKKRYVTNQVMFELVRIKKMSRYLTTDVHKGQQLTLEEIGNICGYTVYQIDSIDGVECELRAGGTVIKILEDGTAELDVSVYPERITEKTPGNYEFELSDDVLEIMPYGIAADLLKSDDSADNGKVYADRYEDLKRTLDPRYHTGGIFVEGGVCI